MDILSRIPNELLLIVIAFSDKSSKFSLSSSSRFYSFLKTTHYEYKDQKYTYPEFKKIRCIETTNHSILQDVIKNGHIELFKWLVPDLNKYSGFSTYRRHHYIHAIKHGSFEILKYIYTKDIEGWTTFAPFVMNVAIDANNIEIVKWLYQNGCNFDERSCIHVARTCNLELLKFLHENKCSWCGEAFFEAIKEDHFETLKYLIDKCEMNSHILEHAAEHCRLDTLKWLYYESPFANLWKPNLNQCAYAAYAGKIETVKWLREIGCPWDTRSCAYAAENGQLDTLKYLHENECPWNYASCENADDNNHFDVLKYLHENGCPCNKNSCAYCNNLSYDVQF